MSRVDMSEPTVPCGLCLQPTNMTGTKRCDRCWELESRIKADEKLAKRILGIREWDDEKAMLVAEAVKKQVPHWTVQNEFQACVSVDPGTSYGMLFWFGDANRNLGAILYQNDECMASGVTMGSVETDLDANACDVEELAKVIIVEVNRILRAVKYIVEGPGLAELPSEEGQSRVRALQLDVVLGFDDIAEMMQGCEEMWAPVEANMEYVLTMALIARRAAEMAAFANQSIAGLLSYKEFKEVQKNEV